MNVACIPSKVAHDAINVSTLYLVKHFLSTFDNTQQTMTL